MKIAQSTLRLGLFTALSACAALFTACPPSSGLKYCATGAKCPAGTVCAGYYCRPTACEKEACSENEVCNQQGQCIPTECADKRCKTGEVCVKGAKCVPPTCVTNTSKTCTDGLVCDPMTSTCIEPSCFLAQCAPDEVCSGGNCIFVNCGPGGSRCPDGQACGDDGTCQDAACIYKSCPEGKSCKAGACVDCSEGGTGCLCGGKTCAPGESCVNGACKAISCDTVACRLGETCSKDGKSCVTPDCLEKTCSSGQVCVKGACESATCGAAACVQGQSCQAGVCIDALCVGKTCGSAEQCVAGHCMVTSPCGTSGATCAAGQVCDAGKCVDKRCVDAVCPAGKVCSAGACISSNCPGQACRAGQVCAKDGKTCVSVECASVTCPSEQICVGGTCEPAACGGATCVQGEACREDQCVDAACLTASCKLGEVCVGGGCYTPYCGPNYDLCPTGTLCDQGRCVETRCVGVTCPSGQSCSGGKCVQGTGCSGVNCPNGQVCLAGACRDSACSSAGCKANQYCVDGVCETAECAGVQCPSSDEICVGGACVPAACGQATCAQGQACDPATEVCVDTLCLTTTCAQGQVCAGGQCVDKDCPGVNCPAGQACVSGRCLDTRCLGVFCPAGFYCSAGSCDHACAATESACGDGIDEDCDALADCADSDCASHTCNDGDLCTANDACIGGLCAGGAAKTCPAPADDCHVGTGVCRPATGKCEYATRVAGATCVPTAAPAACTDYRCNGAAVCTGTPSLPDTTCGAGQVCSAAGTCGADGGAVCNISGTQVAAGQANPANACQYCSPSTNPSAWTARAQGTGCASGACDATGTCKPGCVIGGVFHASGAADPASPCRTCDPAKNPNDWTLKTTGASCGAGKMCDPLGTCLEGCNIGGKIRLEGQLNPANPCEVCRAAQSTTAWSATEDGKSCALGKICKAAVCTDGCWIEGKFVAPKTVMPGDECQACLPASSTTSYMRNDGATCSEGKCINGRCLGGCVITTATGSGSGITEVKTKYAEGATNPKNECQHCDLTSPYDWSNKPDGTACSGGKTCTNGGCGEGCTVGEKHYAPMEKNSANACLYCDPAQSTTKLSQMADNEICGWGKMCYHSLCSAICLIDGIPYPEKSTYPDNPDTAEDESDTCVQCDPTRNFWDWSNCKKHSVCWDEPVGGDDPEGRMCRLGCILKETDTAPLEYYENGEVNPKETCQICDINYSNWWWKPRNEAVDCDPYKVCSDTGHCSFGCGIGGHYYPPDTINYWNKCAICKNYQAVHSWSYLPTGSGCGDNEGVCHNNSCKDGCWIGGAYYGNGGTHAGSGNGACEKCDTSKSRWGWQLNPGATCGTNQKCSSKSATCCAAGASDC